MPQLQQKVHDQVIKTAKMWLIGGIALLIICPIAGYLLYMAGYIVWIIVIGFFMSFFLLYYGWSQLDPMNNKVYRALLENPQEIVGTQLVTNYKPNTKGDRVEDIQAYSVEIVHHTGEKVVFSFAKADREQAKLLLAEVVQAIPHLA
jgi:hypothetical protein